MRAIEMRANEEINQKGREDERPHSCDFNWTTSWLCPCVARPDDAPPMRLLIGIIVMSLLINELFRCASFLVKNFSSRQLARYDDDYGIGNGESISQNKMLARAGDGGRKWDLSCARKPHHAIHVTIHKRDSDSDSMLISRALSWTKQTNRREILD